MHVLLCFDSYEEALDIITWEEIEIVDSEKLKAFKSSNFLKTYKFEDMYVDVLIIQKNTFDAQFRVMTCIQQRNYHLVIHFNYCIAVDDTLEIGTILNIVNEKPGYFSLENGNFNNIYESQWMNNSEFPHHRGGFINMTNAYFNVFVDFEKVVGATLFFENKNDGFDIKNIMECIVAKVYTTNGLGFAYPCLALKQPFYHISVVKKNHNTNTENRSLSVKQLKLAFDFIIEKIK